MTTSPIGLSASASTGSAGALMPSSLLIRMRYGRCCCAPRLVVGALRAASKDAAAGVTRHTATSPAWRPLIESDALRGRGGKRIENEMAACFHHRDAFGLVRKPTRDF